MSLSFAEPAPRLIDPVITGAENIARHLNCCRKTVVREYEAGRLPAFKMAGRTSPLKIRASRLERYIAERERR